MNYFLFLIIIGLGCGGYYEFTTMQKQESDQDATIETLQTDKKKLEDDNAQLTKNVSDAQAKIADLTKQIQTTTTFTEARQQALQPSNAPTSTAPITVAPSPSNNSLGTITTLDGKTYQNCRVLKIKADCIVINYSEGITEISYSLMPPEMQKKFGYDPRQAAAETEAQIQFQEQQKKAASQSAGN